MDEAETREGVSVHSAMSEEYVEEMERRVQMFIDQGFDQEQDIFF